MHYVQKKITHFSMAPRNIIIQMRIIYRKFTTLVMTH